MPMRVTAPLRTKVPRAGVRTIGQRLPHRAARHTEALHQEQLRPNELSVLQMAVDDVAQSALELTVKRLLVARVNGTGIEQLGCGCTHCNGLVAHTRCEVCHKRPAPRTIAQRS
jgi:hypothetical protein